MLRLLDGGNLCLQVSEQDNAQRNAPSVAATIPPGSSAAYPPRRPPQPYLLAFHPSRISSVRADESSETIETVISSDGLSSLPSRNSNSDQTTNEAATPDDVHYESSGSGLSSSESHCFALHFHIPLRNSIHALEFQTTAGVDRKDLLDPIESLRQNGRYSLRRKGRDPLFRRHSDFLAQRFGDSVPLTEEEGTSAATPTSLKNPVTTSQDTPQRPKQTAGPTSSPQVRRHHYHRRHSHGQSPRSRGLRCLDDFDLDPPSAQIRTSHGRSHLSNDAPLTPSSKRYNNNAMTCPSPPLEYVLETSYHRRSKSVGATSEHGGGGATSVIRDSVGEVWCGDNVCVPALEDALQSILNMTSTSTSSSSMWSSTPEQDRAEIEVHITRILSSTDNTSTSAGTVVPEGFEESQHGLEMNVLNHYERDDDLGQSNLTMVPSCSPSSSSSSLVFTRSHVQNRSRQAGATSKQRWIDLENAMAFPTNHNNSSEDRDGHTPVLQRSRSLDPAHLPLLPKDQPLFEMLFGTSLLEDLGVFGTGSVIGSGNRKESKENVDKSNSHNKRKTSKGNEKDDNDDGNDNDNDDNEDDSRDDEELHYDSDPEHARNATKRNSRSGGGRYGTRQREWQGREPTKEMQSEETEPEQHCRPIFTISPDTRERALLFVEADVIAVVEVSINTTEWQSLAHNDSYHICCTPNVRTHTHTHTHMYVPHITVPLFLFHSISLQVLKSFPLMLLWHPDSTTKCRQPRPSCVKAWMERGTYLISNKSFVHPKLMWKPRHEPNLRTNRKLNVNVETIDLLEVTKVYPASSVDRTVRPLANVSKCFVIETRNDVCFYFETETRDEQESLVLAFKLLVARLASLLLTRDVRAVEEFFEPVDAAVPGEAPQWSTGGGGHDRR